MDDMIKCKACDADNHQGAVFCIYCGKTLTEVQNTKQLSKLLGVCLIVVLISIGAGFTAYQMLKPGNELVKTYKDQYELNNLLVMTYEDSRERTSANLYLQSDEKEKELIAEGVSGDTYVLAPKTNQVAYTDESSRLFITKLGNEPVEVARQVDEAYISFTSDEKYVIFGDINNSSDGIYIYNIEEDRKEKLDDSLYTYMSINYDEATETLYFIDQDQMLYKYNQELGKEKIKKNVYRFNILPNSLMMYETYRDGQSAYYIYDIAEDIEEKIGFNYVQIENVALSNDHKMMFFMGQEDDSQSGRMDLYIKIKDNDPIRVQKGILHYEYASDSHTLYYINEDNMLYSIKMPTLNKKALESSELAEQALAGAEKNKIFSGAMIIKVSADGKKVGVQNEENELTLLINGEKLKIDKNIRTYDIFNDYIVYLNQDQALYVQKDIDVNEISEITDKPEKIAKKIKDYYSTTEYGKYVTYIEEENEKEPTYKLMRYSEADSVKTMLDNLDAYDAVSFHNMKYVRKLKYEDIVGKYSCEEFDFVLELDQDHYLTLYNTGEKKADLKVSTVPLTTDSITLEAEQEQILTIYTYLGYEESWSMVLDRNLVLTRNSAESYTLETSNYDLYELRFITDKEFNQEIKAQKEAEAERLKIEAEQLRMEEERRRAEEEERQRISRLENLASEYYYQGVYLPSGTYIYDSANYNSMSTYYTSSDRRWSVSDYYIDYVSSVIWVQIKHTPSSSYSYRYGWIPMT